MADVFEDHPELGHWREHLWRTISATPNLDWQLLTKRPENLRRFLPPLWTTAPNTNVWLGTSVEDRPALERVEALRDQKAPVRFLSAEPLLEDLGTINLRGIDWVIVGGESGPNARPCDLEWIRSIVAQTKAAGVACFVKQLGAKPYRKCHGCTCTADEVRYATGGGPFGAAMACDSALRLVARKGGDPEEWPEDLRVREFPR